MNVYLIGDDIVIFIGGVHGVGKTFFCQRITQQVNIEFYSASELISEMKQEQFAKDKKIKDIDGNQDYLVMSIRHLNETTSNYLLDGHFCLLDSNCEMHRIPYKKFKNLQIKAIVVFFDFPETIAERLKRDGVWHNTATIETFQQEEIEYARGVADSLGIPFIVVDSSCYSLEAVLFIERFLS